MCKISTIFDLFRIFYLCQDTMFTHIKEEGFFICLTWLFPALSGIILSMLLGENFLNPEKSHIFYSSCSKVPMLWEEFTGSIYYNVFALSQLIIVSITFGTQIAIMVRRKQLEKQRPDETMVVTYNHDGVTISRSNPDRPSCHKLWRHNRTVVTPHASLLSHLFRLLILLLAICSHYGPPGLQVVEQLIISITFCTLFFLYSFIETICSPNLRNSLIEFFVGFRH